MLVGYSEVTKRLALEPAGPARAKSDLPTSLRPRSLNQLDGGTSAPKLIYLYLLTTCEKAKQMTLRRVGRRTSRR